MARTSKEIVFSKYPTARAVKVSVMPIIGPKKTVWNIEDEFIQKLGRGETEKAAWTDASKKIQLTEKK